MNTKLFETKYINRCIWIVLLLSVWQIISVSGIVSPLIFPSIDVILKALYQEVVNGQIINETLHSIVLILEGLAFGLAGAMILASLSMLSMTFKGFVETLTAIAHPLPGIALLPLIIIWLGTGTHSIIFIIIHSLIWPMVLNILAGFNAVSKIHKEVGQNLGIAPGRAIVDIMIPASLPYLLAGIKIGWARAWRALISAEMIFGAVGGKGGLGWYIFKQRVFMDTPGIFVGLIIIVLIGIIVEDFVFNKVEDITIKKWGMII